MRPRGIEPRSQPSEGYVLSVEPRARNIQNERAMFYPLRRTSLSESRLDSDASVGVRVGFEPRAHTFLSFASLKRVQSAACAPTDLPSLLGADAVLSS